MAATSISFTINGKAATVSTERDRSLLEVIREDLQLTGTKYGCGEGACGACSVLIDGQRIFSCSTLATEADGKTVTTIEGVAAEGKLHPVQDAFLHEGAYQCGYCTPGMIMAAVSLLKRKPNPTDGEILDSMNHNLCRCCGYVNILSAVRRAAQTSGR